MGLGGGGGGGSGDGGGSGGSGLSRGIPFGDITGLLRGDPKGGGGRGGGPGGPGRGSVFGRAPAGGGRQSSAAVHMVYVLDISLSMREGNKMRKAQEALKKAISELKRRDTFNIVTFCGDIDTFSPEMLAATPENVREATEFVDSIRMGYRTNISAALEMALSQEKATHVFLLSDGEPTTGIVNSDDMRAAVREWNRPKARIITLALGLGEEFRGMPLLKALAEDNNGKFDYINLAK